MGRPKKWRKVCCLPKTNSFGPIDSQIKEKQFVTMTVDEYETIRLIDLEGLTQEECSEKMNIARTTIQRIYSDARKKIAEVLVDEKILRIEGGDYKLCDGLGKECGKGSCNRHSMDDGCPKCKVK